MKFTDFARDELGLTLTRGQRVLALVAFDKLEPRDLVGDEREIARAIFGEVDEIPPLARRILVLLLGRLSGKTLLGAAYALFVMASANVSACGPGDVPTTIIFAPTKKLASLSVRAGLELARRSPRLRKRIEKETADGFYLRRRDGRLVAFEAVAASRGGATGRGVTVLTAIFDEAMFFLSDDAGSYAVNDKDVYGAVAPRAREIIFISTFWPVPTLMGELLAQNWQAPTTATAAKAPTLTMRDNDESIALIVEAERQRDPANAAREFDCDDSAGHGSSLFFDPLSINAAIDSSRPLTIDAPTGARIFSGGDLSQIRDPSTLAIIGVVGEHAHLLDLIERRPQPGRPLKTSETIAEFATALKRYSAGSFVTDNWGREDAREHATSHGITIDAAPENRGGKVLSYLAARKAFSEGRVTIAQHAKLIAQLRSVTVQPAPGGSFIIRSPRRAGSHGDLVSALVLALWAWSNRPAASFSAPAPIYLPDEGGGFEGVSPPAAITGPGVRYRSPAAAADAIVNDELRRYATANADPERDDAHAAFSVASSRPDPLAGF